MKKKWEYKNLKFSYDDIHETDFARVDFEELGLKGWELVSVTQFTPTPWDLGQGDSSIFTAFFKREIIDTSATKEENTKSFDSLSEFIKTQDQANQLMDSIKKL